jgi:hypothetical protein
LAELSHDGKEMKPRHAAALALVGWYLMIPGDNANSPLGKWHVHRAYDTAEECQIGLDAYRQFLGEREHDSKRFEKLTPQDRVKELEKEVDWEFEFGLAQCIASDDPRLAK